MMTLTYQDVVDSLNLLQTTHVWKTGSHYFGNTHADSGFDVYCGPMNDETICEISALDFEKKDIVANFGGVTSVWKHKTFDIYILEVENVEKRFEVQYYIKKYFPEGYSDKKYNAKGIWDLAESLYDSQNAIFRSSDILHKALHY